MTLRAGREDVNHAATGVVLMLAFCSASPIPISARGPAYPKSPKEVLQTYRKMDAQGERLTPAGWYRASRYFVKPGRPPQRIVMEVTEGERVTDLNPWFKGGSNRVEISVVCSAVGQIDSSGRFTSVIAPTLTDPPRPGGLQMHGPAPLERLYDLVLTDTRWEFGPGREGLREVKGPPEWRIENFESQPWVTIEVAIRYLTKLHGESSSDIIKGNADKSIAALRGLLKVLKGKPAATGE